MCEQGGGVKLSTDPHVSETWDSTTLLLRSLTKPNNLIRGPQNCALTLTCHSSAKNANGPAATNQGPFSF